ncbi:MAG: hypothetical protein Q9170_002513 [Blastenia crenularia]
MFFLQVRDVGFEGRGFRLTLVSIIFPIISLATVIVRFVCRYNYARRSERFGADDWVIAISEICAILLASATLFSVDHGIGQHIATLTPDDEKQALVAFYISQILYKLTVNPTKLSLLLLYLRIFPSTTFRRFTMIFISIVSLYATASIFATIFQCQPVGRAWAHSVLGTCINVTGFWYANAVWNILTDALTLLWPVPMIYALQLPRSDKWGLYSIFGLGALHDLRNRRIYPLV